jgi:uncharacterized membrane protein YhiD involved in acid resistance
MNGMQVESVQLFRLESVFLVRQGLVAFHRHTSRGLTMLQITGAGLIFKENTKTKDGESSHVVHGLTTAASLWLSAAVGIACGGELYFSASFGTAIMLLLLRFGPRNADLQEDEEDEEEGIDQASAVGITPMQKYEPTETDSLVGSVGTKRASIRSRASLASVV